MDALININDCFKLKSQSLDLNYSGTREMVVVVNSVYPEVKLTIRLVAVDHRCYVEMSKGTFCTVMQHSSKAISCMNREHETEIFSNEYIDVFTECMHDKCAVCFVDHRGERVNMMVKTFKNMKNKYDDILSECTAIYSKINSTAANFKIIIDLIFNKMEQKQLDDEEFKNYVTGIKQHLDTLRTMKPPRERHPHIEFEEDSLFDDEYYKECYKCGCTCRS